MSAKELNIGDYVRTKYGIGKITYINSSKTAITTDYQTNKNIRKNLSIKEIIKSSPNIIDLIEVGDYLNGWRVNNIEKSDSGSGTIIKIGNTTFNVLEDEEIYTPVRENDGYYQKIEKLNSIVTKEQFESMKYKIGE